MNLQPALRRIFPFILLILSSVSILNAQTISTFAGGNNGEGRPATSIGLINVQTIVADSADNVYMYDAISHTVRKISAATGIVSTVTGGGDSVTTDTLPALDVFFSTVRGITIDKAGKIYIADLRIIWKYDPSTEQMVIVAGSPQRLPFGGDNGPAKSAGFENITSITVDSIGNLYVTDANRIRKITAATGIINTIAGTGADGFSGNNVPALDAKFSSPRSITINKTGNVYVADNNNNIVRKIDLTTNIVSTVAGIYGSPAFGGDGGLATLARLAGANAIAFDADDNLFIGDLTRIRKVSSSTGIITTIAGSGTAGSTGDGGQASAATLKTVFDLYMNRNGNLFIAEYTDGLVRKLNLATGVITRVAGNGELGISGIGGPAKDAQLFNTRTVSVDRQNNVYTATTNKILKVDAITKIITLVAGSGDATINGGNGGPATQASLNNVSSIRFDSYGNYYLIDGSACVRKVDISTGIISAFAGTGEYGFSGDGGPATAATFKGISDIAIDAFNNVYINDGLNYRIRKVNAATGIVTTIAGNGTAASSDDGALAINASVNQPNSIVVDKKGNILFSESSSNKIRKIDAVTAILTTFAGTGIRGSGGDNGLAIAAQLESYSIITLDASENVYISAGANKVRKVDIGTGIITTVVGTGEYGYNGENIPLNATKLMNPQGMAFDNSNNLYIAESGRNAIRLATNVGQQAYKAILSGTVFYDINGNGTKDVNESFADGITVSIRKDSFELVTVSKQGLFKLQVDSGSYITKPLNLEYYDIMPDSVSTVFTSQFSADSISFALQPMANKNDLRVSLIPVTVVRPGFKTAYKIEYGNEGTVTANNVSLMFVKSSKININSTTPAYSNISGDTLTWNLNNIAPNNKGTITIDATVAVPPIANLNDSMFSSAIIKQDATDLTPLNDTSRIKQRVQGSYDPNDKAETHGGAMTPAQVAAGDYLNYVIRFQNTGTDTAFTVVVRDTLDNMLDLASLQTISSSHNCQLTITDGNKLAWRFDNILLADSNINEPASHGYIAFRIKPKPTVNLGDIISNRSDIYFDFNQPVRTNTSSTVIKLLPSAPVKPVLNLTSAQYCVSSGAQRVSILNRDAGITAIATVGSFAAPVGVDTAFTVMPSLLIPGNYIVRVEYINESGSNSTLVPVTVIATATPELTVNANKTTITTEPDAVVISATDKKGGGSNPLFSFAKDRSFTNIIQAESITKTATINSTNLANGDNWIYIRMKTSETCFTVATVVDSVKVTKTLAPTGLIDIDNPNVSITGYPNPVREGFTISGLASHKNYSVKIYDTRGVLIHSTIIRNKTSHYIRSAGWNSGMYWINIFDMKKNRLIGAMRVVK